MATLSTRTALSPAFHTVTSTCSRSPGVTMPSSAAPSIVTPAAFVIARSSKARCTESAGPRSRRARIRYGRVAPGRHGVSAPRAESMSAAYPVT